MFKEKKLNAQVAQLMTSLQALNLEHAQLKKVAEGHSLDNQTLKTEIATHKKGHEDAAAEREKFRNLLANCRCARDENHRPIADADDLYGKYRSLLSENEQLKKQLAELGKK